MQSDPFVFQDFQGFRIFVHHWRPDPGTVEKAVVMIVHGLAEHAGRYERFANDLTMAGYRVYAPDHRGHGRTAEKIENVGYLGEDGFNAAVGDLRQLNQIIREKHPGLPVFILGHSMGSFLVQKYISLFGLTIQGAILSGTSGSQGPALYGGLVLAKLIKWLKGAQSPSPFLHHLSFAGYNKAIRPIRTAYDWLSRDTAEVDRYIADPFCGYVLSARFYYDLFRGLLDIHKLKNQRHIPLELPLYIFCGAQDPVGSYTRTVRQLILTYQKIGIRDVSYRFYPGGRHEMLNEVNRDAVSADIIAWLERHLPSNDCK